MGTHVEIKWRSADAVLLRFTEACATTAEPVSYQLAPLPFQHERHCRVITSTVVKQINFLENTCRSFILLITVYLVSAFNTVNTSGNRAEYFYSYSLF